MKRRRIIQFTVPSDVAAGSEIERLHMLWAILEPTTLQEASRLCYWALSKIEQRDIDRLKRPATTSPAASTNAETDSLHRTEGA